MVLLVPFDGSRLSEAALVRANEFGSLLDESVLVLTVIPPDEDYARTLGWVDAEEQFSTKTVADRLAARVGELAPDAGFRWEVTDEVDARATLTTDVVRTIREVAAEVDASILFIGSENVGKVATPVSSIGHPLSEDPRYDLHVVRHPISDR